MFSLFSSRFLKRSAFSVTSNKHLSNHRRGKAFYKVYLLSVSLRPFYIQNIARIAAGYIRIRYSLIAH